jgi:hypothetical protein
VAPLVSPPRRAHIAALILSVVALVGAGCTAQGTELEDSPQGLEDATGFTEDGWNRLLRGHEGRLVTCMRSRGFKFWSTASWDYLTLGPHGLFGLTTPSAELSYLTKYGYGVAHRVTVLRNEVAAARRPSNEAYVSRLGAERRKAYARALFGDDARAGCAQPGSDVVLRLGLPDGGELGDSFAEALERARETSEYHAWQSSVVDCLEEAGIEVPAGDLGQMERPFLKRLLNLAGSEYSRTHDGAIRYDFSSKEAAKIPMTALRALRRDEMSTAAVEAGCRREAGSGAQDAVDAASAPLVGAYGDEVSLLRSALRRVQ